MTTVALRWNVYLRREVVDGRSIESGAYQIDVFILAKKTTLNFFTFESKNLVIAGRGISCFPVNFGSGR